MTLKQKLEQELKTALKAHQEYEVNALREILSNIRYAEIEKGQTLTEADQIELLHKLKKRHLESIEAFKKGNRPELVAKEEQELKVIEKFLPAPLTPEEITQMVRQAIAVLGAKSLKDMGKVMASIKDSYIGRAEGRVVSEEVKKQLSEMADA